MTAAKERKRPRRQKARADEHGQPEEERLPTVGEHWAAAFLACNVAAWRDAAKRRAAREERKR